MAIEKILFVDDEPSILDGYKRILRKEFEVDTAVGGEQGLAMIRDLGPYAVVVSDMRMPGMNGAKFLAHVLKMAPDTVRMLLTGYADVDATIEAVNAGNIFRFLSKPCETELLSGALHSCIAQYRLVTAEKELLEKTLMGSIKVLTEVLALASPEAFGTSMRIARYVRHLASKLGLPSPWRFDAAAMLSQLGCVTLDYETIRAGYAGEPVSSEEQARFAAHPQKAKELLARIPRLEPIAWMIGQQLAKVMPSADPSLFWPDMDDILRGANILRLAVAFDSLTRKGLQKHDAIAELRLRAEFEPGMIEMLEGLNPEVAAMQLRKVSTARLMTGMVLRQEIRARNGTLMIQEGQEITSALRIKLENLAQAGRIDDEVMAMVPV